MTPFSTESSEFSIKPENTEKRQLQFELHA